MTSQTKTEYIIISRQTGDEVVATCSLGWAVSMAGCAGKENVRIIERITRTETEEREVAL